MFDWSFSLTLYQKEIIEPRVEAMKEGRIIREREPIGIRRKDFWDVQTTSALLGEKFTKKLGHEPDGLVFQPIEEVTMPKATNHHTLSTSFLSYSPIKQANVRPS